MKLLLLVAYMLLPGVVSSTATHLAQLFRLWDADGDGSVSATDIQTIFSRDVRPVFAYGHQFNLKIRIMIVPLSRASSLSIDTKATVTASGRLLRLHVHSPPSIRQ